jgi:hypothetical protein
MNFLWISKDLTCYSQNTLKGKNQFATRTLETFEPSQKCPPAKNPSQTSPRRRGRARCQWCGLGAGKQITRGFNWAPRTYWWRICCRRVGAAKPGGGSRGCPKVWQGKGCASQRAAPEAPLVVSARWFSDFGLSRGTCLYGHSRGSGVWCWFFSVFGCGVLFFGWLFEWVVEVA